jgi:hypothetical protein
MIPAKTTLKQLHRSSVYLSLAEGLLKPMEISDIDILHDDGLSTYHLPLAEFGIRQPQPDTSTPLTTRQFREQEKLNYKDISEDPLRRMETLSFRHFKIYCQCMRGGCFH